MIWLIGSKGMLGTELAAVLRSRGSAFTATDREVDIRDPAALLGFAAQSALDGAPVDWIVNCSAYTAVDRAEEEEEVAHHINAVGAENIAAVAQKLGARMVHVSTDYVFRGDGNEPYLESDPVAPSSAYGRTKADGELRIAARCARHFIVRTAWLYGRHGPNFVYTMLKLMRAREAISVVADQQGTPTWTFDLSSAIADIVERGGSRFGIYHFTNVGQTTWHGFADEIQRLGRELGILGRACTVNAITSDQYPSKVKRPAWSVLSKKKISEELGITPPHWRESLHAFLSSLVGWPELDDKIGPNVVTNSAG
jgi:dTDP-4-dehydrorhamnose reductase